MPRRAATCATTLAAYEARIASAERLLQAAGDRPGAIEFALAALERALSDATNAVIKTANLTGVLTEKRHPVAGRYLGLAATTVQAAA